MTSASSDGAAQGVLHLAQQQQHPPSQGDRRQALADALANVAEQGAGSERCRAGRRATAVPARTSPAASSGSASSSIRSRRRIWAPAERKTSMESRLQGVKPLPPATAIRGPSPPRSVSQFCGERNPRWPASVISPSTSTWRETASSRVGSRGRPHAPGGTVSQPGPSPSKRQPTTGRSSSANTRLKQLAVLPVGDSGQDGSGQVESDQSTILRPSLTSAGCPCPNPGSRAPPPRGSREDGLHPREASPRPPVGPARRRWRRARRDGRPGWPRRTGREETRRSYSAGSRKAVPSQRSQQETGLSGPRW